MSVQERFRARYFGPQGIIEGIRVCLSHEHSASALGLVCAAVESMTFLGLPEERDEICDTDFIAWVNRFLRPDKVGIGGRDLWTVRSALLNQRLSQRQAARGGKMREILFAWGRYHVMGGMELRPGSRWHRVMTIYSDELYKTLFLGAEQFCHEVIALPENAYLMGVRLNQVFGQMRLEE